VPSVYILVELQEINNIQYEMSKIWMVQQLNNGKVTEARHSGMITKHAEEDNSITIRDIFSI
jgi:hypothetical protein